MLSQYHPVLHTVMDTLDDKFATFWEEGFLHAIQNGTHLKMHEFFISGIFYLMISDHS